MAASNRAGDDVTN